MCRIVSCAETTRAVANAPKNEEDLQNLLVVPPLLHNFELQKDPLSPRTLLAPESAYGQAMVDELGKSGISVKELAADRVRTIKGTAAIAVLDHASGAVKTAERPGVIVFADAD